jgi:hypothetical protein
MRAPDIIEDLCLLSAWDLLDILDVRQGCQ